MGLSTLRTEVSDALTGAGFKTTTFIPERVTPPVAIISAADPYVVETGTTFNSFLVRLEVTLVAGTATNAVATENLDGLIEEAIICLGGWTVEVSQPFMLSANNANYLSARLTITNTTEISV